MNLNTETATTTTELPAPIRGFLIEIGKLTFPIYGNAAIGWSIMRGDIVELTPYRYGTLDELLFALLNYSVVSAGDVSTGDA